MKKWISLVLLIIVVLFALFAGYVLGRGELGGYRAYGFTKMDTVLSLIQGYYVDTTHIKKVQENAINDVLQRLDPHSVYLTPTQNQAANQGLIGEFCGIGVQFNTLKDTVIVVHVIPGGPSERAHILAGDRILKANNINLVGKSSDSIMLSLKGKRNSVVSLDILRKNKPMTVKVVRGDVPIKTVKAYMIAPHILYLNISEWGIKTHQEIINAYNTYAKDTIKGILMDLRDNPGGLLSTAISVANDFLPDKGKLMLYAKGAHFRKESYFSNGNGLFSNMPLVVLVNQNSASASEIFSGIMQDYDRATIVGRRTFGKGLVQEPFRLKDGSVIRLTIARYYIPSGRCIQKSYKSGELAYQEDIMKRYIDGELSQASKYKPSDTTKYYTNKGRVVYGGGGIFPDVFVPIDSTGITSYYMEVNQKILPVKFAFDYVDKHRATLDSYHNTNQLLSYLDGQHIVQQFISYASTKGIKPSYFLIKRSHDRLRKQLYSNILSLLYNDSSTIKYLNKTDPDVQRGLTLLLQGKWKPEI